MHFILGSAGWWNVILGDQYMDIVAGLWRAHPAALGSGNIKTWELINLVLHAILEAAFSKDIFAQLSVHSKRTCQRWP